MSLSLPLQVLRRARLVFWLCLGMITLDSVQAAERLIETRLVWGTNEEKSSDPSHKLLEDSLAKKLKSQPFKFTNYFEIFRKIVPVNDQQFTRVEMSKKCNLEMKDQGQSKINVRFYGEGKLLREEKNFPLPKGETLGIGGDVKDGGAWFIILRPSEGPTK
jgi:hypothetical protein